MGDGPVDLAVSPDGRPVYMSLYNSDALKVIDAADNTVTATFEPGGGTAVHLCRQGGLRVLDATTGCVRTTVPVDGQPRQVVISSDDMRAYVNAFRLLRQPQAVMFEALSLVVAVFGAGLMESAPV
jgi:YVTN family beta-propeller protein